MGHSEIENRCIQLYEALAQAVKVIKMFHGDEVFDIYFHHSPEMKLIREVAPNLQQARSSGAAKEMSEQPKMKRSDRMPSNEGDIGI